MSGKYYSFSEYSSYPSYYYLLGLLAVLIDGEVGDLVISTDLPTFLVRRLHSFLYPDETESKKDNVSASSPSHGSDSSETAQELPHKIETLASPQLAQVSLQKEDDVVREMVMRILSPVLSFLNSL